MGKKLLALGVLFMFSFGNLWAMGRRVEVKSQKSKVKSQKVKAKSEKAEVKKLVPKEIKGVELEVVWEKEFEEPVVDVIFGETEMTVKEAEALGMKNLAPQRINEKVKVMYPKAVRVPRKVYPSEKGIKRRFYSNAKIFL
jgi:hypothetical protein